MDNLEYWESRAQQFGARSVLNLAHDADELNRVTEYQISEVFPHLSQLLDGSENATLDFGCGVGRFSTHLAGLTGGRVIGVDPIQTLLEQTPSGDSIEFRRIENGIIPIESESIDFVWIALVLGGIRTEDLESAVREIKRVLKADGKICLIENTTQQRDVEHWYFRELEFYKALFPSYSLKEIHTYDDVGESISVMFGRGDSLIDSND